MRAVLDVNILISSLISPRGAPAAIVRAWLNGHFDLVTSPLLIEELQRALSYPKLRSRIDAEEASGFVELLRRESRQATDPEAPLPVRSADPGDDYLIALAAAEQALLVSGDRHLLDLARGSSVPIRSAAEFLVLLDS